MKERQTYYSFSVTNSDQWTQRKLGDFDTASAAVAVSGAIDASAFVLSAEDIRQIAEGKMTIPSLWPQARIDLAHRCAEQIGDSGLTAAWSRSLDVLAATPKKRDLEKVRKRASPSRVVS